MKYERNSLRSKVQNRAGSQLYTVLRLFIKSKRSTRYTS
mgnify:CR=1 FL=1